MTPNKGNSCSEQDICLLELAADCLPISSLGTHQFSLLNGINTPAKSCENEPMTDGFQGCTCTKETFGCSIHPTTPEAWIASMQASLARICQLLEIKQDSVKEQEAAFTEKCYESLAWFDRDTYSWKTYQQSFLEGWEPYSQTWPRAGMTVGGVAWKHRESERRIGVTDGGYLQEWRTPTVGMLNADRSNDPEYGNRKAAKGQTITLADQVRPGFIWQTPVADDAVNRKAGKWNSRGEPKLSAQVMMWPTPTVHGNYNRKGASANSGDGLATAVKLWPTPTTNDAKNSTLPESQRNLDGMAGALIAQGAPAGGQLNPTWVEWLMAWPLGWTALKHWETVKSRSRRQSHGDGSEGQ